MSGLSAKATYNFLAFLEIVLVLAMMVGIKGAELAANGQSIWMFFIYATYAALVPVTLCALCHGMRILIKKEIKND